MIMYEGLQGLEATVTGLARGDNAATDFAAGVLAIKASTQGPLVLLAALIICRGAVCISVAGTGRKSSSG
jgi:hypothetical protein